MKIYPIFMMPKATHLRLSTSMQPTDMNWQIVNLQVSEQPGIEAGFEPYKELKLKLSLEIRNCGDVIVVHCQGRIVYRDEAAEFSRVVGDVLEQARRVVLDLSGVSAMDSAGIGELALVQTCAREKNVELKCGAQGMVRSVLALTNLDAVVEVHSSLDEALASFREEQVCADC
jgi:anti-sigma B factor antagonist